ncbi:phosphomannomutase/phosphoglucomutase [Legionella anisa]|uniref:phosphomannomutase n=1 Tax=Legionella anisa TaxID=28082 RepID=A0AAX0WSP2_9GAMM|nr:phosphomannomutase/phosphoglucomutase [Legionella anisa]AWN74942.1 phosphomannomutase/phosphoglucomutase [Legionella anisa]KTC72257.1 phosphomannomutase [Legionella anisa]MBN5936511.1 phosphomannomutase/phosphoglucomutase [Legionella anisa]MCW8424855.1 phosphomannomutase/phosphoglucomutase [Legionella anisa]MCW8446026.1 phosphomannomutase/phosphoglucomutase [Legionella anisa]
MNQDKSIKSTQKKTYRQIQVPRTVFKAYDIRGIIGKELYENSFYSIGLGLGYYLSKLQRQKIVLARDSRLTSPVLALALKQGLLDSGIDAFDLGLTTTPMMYFATHTQGIDSGVMVTGSHNPINYNGIKIVLAGKTLMQEDIRILYTMIAEGKRVNGCGKEIELDIMEEYTKRIVSDMQIKRSLKIIVDCGNGTAGLVAPQVLEKLGCEVIPLYCDVDGRFPNHHPDPTIEANLVDLKNEVVAQKADLGFAFDGDADRLGLVTNTGETIHPDRLMMLYARELLTSCPGGIIVFDVKCSNNLAAVIKDAGGIAKMCPTGHSIVKDVMKKEGAILAGEMSGHLFFKNRWYGFDDALYSACRLLEIITSSNLTISDQFKLIPDSVGTSELKIAMADEEKFVFMHRFSEKAKFPQAQIITIDGVRVEFATGWGILRASNTTPCLVARFEAVDKESLLHIQQLFKTQILLLEPKLALPF